MKKTLFTLILSSLILFCSQCSSKKNIGNQDYESKRMSLQNRNVKLKFYHLSDDTTSLLIKIKNSELLESRVSGDENLNAKVQSTIIFYNLKTGNPVDTILYDIYGQNKGYESFYYFNRYSFKLKAGENYKYHLSLKDKNRGTHYKLSGIVDKTSSICEENFLLFEDSLSHPIFSSFINTKKTYSLISHRIDLTTIQLLFNPNEGNLPPPPYSTSKPKTPSIETFQKVNFNTTKDTIMFKDFQAGEFLLFKDNIGTTIISRPDFHPEIGTVSDMISPLRYISARKEFERINSNSNLQNGLEKFWLDCGDNKERSTELMSIFYERVEISNLNFSSFKNGWKTDRGLIYIVFGEPTETEILTDSETWIYGDKTDIGSIEFVFDKVENNLNPNHFELRRNSIYKSEWAKRVSAWRNGRIYN